MAMRRSTRMMVGRSAAEDRRGPGRKMEIEYERWDDPRGDWREPVRMGGYEPESRFRDRRGREHYNNGRFAPMSAGGYGPYADDRDGRRYREEDEEMRPIGFMPPRMTSDATVRRYNEMERMPGRGAMLGGYMADRREYPTMDDQTAVEWVNSMHNEDGTKGAHWTMEQVRQVVKQKGINDIELPELYAVLNALYSDYDPVLKKHGVSNMECYMDLARAWIRDKDAVPNKAMAYYACVVKK